MNYNPNLDLVFGIFMILVPFILLGALGIAVVVYSKKETPPTSTNPEATSISSAGSETVETPSAMEILALATQLEDLLRKRVNGAPDLRISNGTHDQKLAEELSIWAEWERRLQNTPPEQE